MITGEIKSKIDSLWEIFRTGGLTTPLNMFCESKTRYLMQFDDYPLWDVA